MEAVGDGARVSSSAAEPERGLLVTWAVGGAKLSARLLLGVLVALMALGLIASEVLLITGTGAARRCVLSGMSSSASGAGDGDGDGDGDDGGPEVSTCSRGGARVLFWAMMGFR